MTPTEILCQEAGKIDERIPDAIYAEEPVFDNDNMFCCFGLATAEKKNVDNKSKIPLKQYAHFYVETKRYNDETCATFELIKKLETLPDNIEKIIWRKKPRVWKETTFHSDRWWWVGRAKARFYPPIESMVK